MHWLALYFHLVGGVLALFFGYVHLMEWFCAVMEAKEDAKEW